jgi:FkbM family methyltransferase
MGLLTEVGRRFLLFCHKPRHWRLRPGTVDRRLFREVVIQNQYRLPRHFRREDVVLDVGGHVGSFTYAVLRRGAGAVWCCEAGATNFRLLQHNLFPYRDRVRLLYGAVWRSDAAVTHLGLHNPQCEANTGAIQVTDGPAARRVPVVPFDELIDRATDGGARRVRLLKLDCEASEWPILLTSRRLDRIDAVCGEYHVVPAAGLFAVAGHDEYTPDLLERYLGAQGFRVHTVPEPRRPGELGLFFAERVSDPTGSAQGGDEGGGHLRRGGAAAEVGGEGAAFGQDALRGGEEAAADRPLPFRFQQVEGRQQQR